MFMTVRYFYFCFTLSLSGPDSQDELVCLQQVKVLPPNQAQQGHLSKRGVSVAPEPHEPPSRSRQHPQALDSGHLACELGHQSQSNLWLRIHPSTPLNYQGAQSVPQQRRYLLSSSCSSLQNRDRHFQTQQLLRLCSSSPLDHRLALDLRRAHLRIANPSVREADRRSFRRLPAAPPAVVVSVGARSAARR